MAFNLDDVRESFTNDVTRFLAEIEKGSKAVASAATLAVPSERTWQLPVNAMVVGLHGIVGSSSLVGLDTMTSPARRLEEIATSAAESIRMLKLHGARLQKIASLCLDGSSDLRVILEHELAGRSADAETRRAVLSAKLAAATHDLSAEPPPRPAGMPEMVEVEPPARRSQPVIALPDEDDGWDDEPAPQPAEELCADDELAQVFQGEARETLTNLRGYLARLAHQPGDREAATQCARLLHLLKGAAASVALEDIADRSRDLHDEIEHARSVGMDAANVAKLRAGIEELIALAVPDLAVLTTAESSAAIPLEDLDAESRQIFQDEASGSLQEARVLLQQVRATAGTARGVATSRVERILHRLKGSALIVGEAQVAAVASRGQALCEALEKVDPGALASVLDQLDQLIGVPIAQRAATRGPSLVRVQLPPRDEWEVYSEESSELLDELDRLLANVESSKRPAADLSAMFRAYHTLKGATHAVGLTPIGQHLHIIEAFLERLVASSEVEELRAIVHALTEQNSLIRKNIHSAAAEGTVEIDHDQAQTRLAQLGTDRGGASQGPSWINPADSVWSHESSVEHSAKDGSHASVADDVRDSDAQNSRAAAERRFIRVPADRLDSLLDLAGELVVCRSRMISRVTKLKALQEDDQVRLETVTDLIDGFAGATQFTNLDGGHRRRAVHADSNLGFGELEMDQYEEVHVLSRRLDEAASDLTEVRRDMTTEMDNLHDDAESLSAIVSNLQSEITRARMLTLEMLLNRLRLPIRDAAERSKREIQIVTSGEQLAIDKSMSDALYGPLLHMVRNSVVHGIETPDQRARLGKPRAGTVSLAARQEHGQIVLEISDDGAGIDTRKLLQLGIERGLLSPATAEDDPRVVELIFAKGLSTAETVDEVAGRGIGGDVIRRAIDRLNGAIQIQTARGKGTTFRITLPMSMSITQAVLVRVGGILLAIPIAFAETILAREGIEVVDSFGRMRARIGERMIPVHLTEKIFDAGMLRSEPTGRVFVVCAVGAERIVVQVDEVVGQEEIVVKSLGLLLEGHPLFSGSTSRGDGELALIMDIPGVLGSETMADRRGAQRPAAPPPIPKVAPKPLPPKAQTSVPANVPSEIPFIEPDEELVRGPNAIQVTEVLPLPDHRLRVLFVDDSLSVRKVAERMIKSLDVEVITAVDGMDALDKLRGMAFSLVFTDLEMPRMHGYELIREMQLLPANKEIPVVVISSRSGQKHIDQAIQSGAREYLTKPFSAEILGAVLARLAKKGER